MNEELFNEAAKSNVLTKEADEPASGKHDLQQYLLYQLDDRSSDSDQEPWSI